MNLLWIDKKQYESIIDDNVFQDLGITSLFEKFRLNFFDILDIIKYIPKEDTIKYRGEIFNDFLSDNDNYLCDIKKLADDVVYFYKGYNLTKQTLKRYFVFILYINSYITFYEQTSILLDRLNLTSKGLLSLREHVKMVVASHDFINMKNDADSISFEGIKKYVISNKNKYIILEGYDDYDTLNSSLRKLVEDLSDEIEIRSYSHSPQDIDSLYLAALEKYYSDEIRPLQEFHMKYANIEFPLSELGDQIGYFLFFKSIFKECKIPYCVPSISYNVIKFKNVYNISLYGIATDIVSNDIDLDGVNVVTGVNGGGKTSFLQSIGANYIFYFAVGHVFADSAELMVLEYLYTHFPTTEEFRLGYGRLKNELHRLKKISPNFSEGCLLLLNETFSSTDDETALGHAEKLIKELQNSKTKCVFVTHHQNIINIPDINIFVPLTDKNNNRLFKIVRKTDDVNMYTFDILYRYGLTKEQLEERLKNEKV